MRISSSDTVSSSASVLSRSSRNTPLVLTLNSQITGFMITEIALTTTEVTRATSRGFCMAMRLGTSSPSTRVK